MGRKPVILVGLVLLVVLAACARQGYPTGGPKDETPPRPLACKPLNESRHFGEQEFYIQFDEYVVLKNANDNVLVSPPLKNKPEYTTKGRGVLVKINDTLRPNTTYLFQFKDAIADFTEGNLLPSFEYVFSTGDTMDTLMLGGTVSDARSGSPWKEAVTVMAYRTDDHTLDTLGDTLATTAQPHFVTRCDKSGHFAFHYLPAGTYRLVALEDKNRNLRLDADEPAAWTTMAHAAADSLDSLSLVRLPLSTPEVRRQRIVSSEMVDKGRAVITTAAPLLNPTVSGTEGLWRLNAKRDSLTFWCLDAQRDTATLIVSDSSLQDTLKLRYRKKPAAQKLSRGRSHTEQAAPAIPLAKALCEGSSAFYDDLRLAFTNPITKVADSARAEIMRLKDSTVAMAPITLDTTGLTARIEASLHPGEQYTMRIAKGLFTDLYGTANDTLRFNLTPKDYGILTLHIAIPTGGQLLLEVLDKRDTVVQSQPLAGSGTVRFTRLAAGEYRIRAIFDTDGNGRWTPGDYRKQQQPEQTALFEKTLQLRERWEMEERWTPLKPED